MKESSKIISESVREWDDAFLALFSHRFDYIWAEHSNPGERVEWKTESRHPLADRLIQQGAYLYGVRFGAETNYCLLDIDAGSIYHPQRDPFAIDRIAAALEPLGLVRYLACTSSYSGGLHLYFPFPQAQSSWQLSIALACLLENAGFKLQPGQLEAFPNPKPYVVDGTPSLFNAHRLPLQSGSYRLNEAFQPIWSDAQTFVQQWQLIQPCNDIDRKTLKLILKQARRKHFGISGKAEKFVNDLNAEIALGWTGAGQTNRLLGRITMRAYIFHHILTGGEPLEGAALVSEIVKTAQALPGYSEWCRHQHEIEHRAEEWARCIEGSHYFHFGEQVKPSQPSAKSSVQDPELTAAIDQSPSWNQRQTAATRDRIRRAIAALLETNTLPIKATARFQTLLGFGIGGASLYRHRDLWHPKHYGLDHSDVDSLSGLESTSFMENTPLTAPVENPPDPPMLQMDSQLNCVGDASNWLSPASLFPSSDGNVPSDKAFSDRQVNHTLLPASNAANQGDGQAPGEPVTHPFPVEALQGASDTQPSLLLWAQPQAPLDATRPPQVQHQQLKVAAAVQRQRERMQKFWDSGDPILVAEALTWAHVNPGVLAARVEVGG